MKISIYALLSFSFLIISSAVYSQVIWTEDFESYSVGTGYMGSSDPVAAIPSGDYPSAVSKWSVDTSSAQLTANSDWLSVQLDAVGNKVFECRDSDGEFVWSSEVISIAGYLDIVLQVLITEVSDLESTDYINVYYKLDGGVELLFDTNGANSNDFTSRIAKHENLTGSTIQIIIKGKNTAGTEKIRFDDVLIAEKSLLITEVSSPSDNSSASYIELQNNSNHLLDFNTDTYYLSMQSNGGDWVDVLLTGSLCAGCVTLYAKSSTSFSAAYGFAPPNADSLIIGDGNDAYFVFYNGNHSTGAVVDAFGTFNTDGAGALWEYTNSRAVRDTSTVVGLPIWRSSEWTINIAASAAMSPGALENEFRYFNSIWHPQAIAPSLNSGSYSVIVQEGEVSISESILCSSLTVFPSTILNINPGLGASVSSDCVNEGTLNIISDTLSSGSLIVSGECSGNLNYQLYTTGGVSSPWHLISSPLKGTAINGFVTNPANSIQSSVSNNYGLAEYNTSTAAWNYFHNGLGESPNIAISNAGDFQDAKGYSILRSSSGVVHFSGLLNTVDQSISIDGSKWNLIGNPYPGFVSVNSNASSVDNLINTNSTLIDPFFQAVYIWDSSLSNYTVVNQASPATYLAPGQAVFVLASSSGGTYSFPVSQLNHQTGDWFERNAVESYPSIELFVNAVDFSSKTAVKFIENKSIGLDQGYDAGRFSSSLDDFFVATNLVDGTAPEIDLAVQCLPALNHDNLYSIPIVLNSDVERDLTIQLNLQNIPEGFEFYLVDQLTNTSTNLSANASTYSCLVDQSTYASNRFSLSVVSTSSIGLEEVKTIPFFIYSGVTLSCLQIPKEFLHKARVSVYTIQASLIYNSKIVSNSLYLPKLPTGIYLIRLEHENSVVIGKLKI